MSVLSTVCTIFYLWIGSTRRASITHMADIQSLTSQSDSILSLTSYEQSSLMKEKSIKKEEKMIALQEDMIRKQQEIVTLREENESVV